MAYYFQSMPKTIEMKCYKQPVGVTAWSCWKCCAVWTRVFDRRTPSGSIVTVGSMEFSVVGDEEAEGQERFPKPQKNLKN